MRQSAQKDKILVVDDSPENLWLVESILREEGYEIVLAKDGLLALDLIKQSVFHLIVLDVMMPGVDGFEVTRQIRQEPNLPYIPILLITAHEQSNAVQGLDLGADDFIRKPVDINELLARVRSLLRLKHSVDRLEHSIRVREDYISWLTHDLRIPLVAANRMLNLLQQGALGELSPSVSEAIATITRSNLNLLGMANNLLAVYRYEFDRKALSFVEVDIKILAQEVVRELMPLAQEKSLTLDLEIIDKANAEGAAPGFRIQGDRLELHRLMTNLIGNGIKFTDRGSVLVRLRLSRPKLDANGDKANAWIIFAVQDTGSGISPQEQVFLFDRFRARKPKKSGSGLGLHLSRQIVETHQGTITLKSKLGVGSLFIVRFPAII
ncbi:hybrid sensor histidine kinase/response regulator [Candidatus Gracilibacteria bacterium]|nr:hybrid sensor histidine kinase/response regulator [Candidatus Gracilibacteria bacterium]NJM88526.1 hybrid sensor histidine kinase/response regulator [Hydrococcus sp. RU_2_2]NJP21251.1 hybrid sensor histidine kinase/response regulator [Hydrococcus sp. CRU_1_1]